MMWFDREAREWEDEPMPCCAFAACVVGQFVVAFAAVKRWLFGEVDERNAAVEWRLDMSPAPVPRATSLPRRRAVRIFAIAAAVELLLVIGAFYGLTTHLRHGAEHAGHGHSQEVQP